MAETVHPEVTWAQRSSKDDAARNIIYLTINAPDVPKSSLKLDLQPTKLVFNGKSTTKNVVYACDFEFFEEIDPKESKINHTDRDIELVLRKKEAKVEYWTRLLKDKAKAHWLKTDFDKWVDEDEQDPNDDDDWMAKAGGLDGEGIDFSKFGAGPGGMAPEMPEDLSDEEDLPEDDEDMPALEGEEEEVSHTGASKKIEEVE